MPSAASARSATPAEYTSAPVVTLVARVVDDLLAPPEGDGLLAKVAAHDPRSPAVSGGRARAVGWLWLASDGAPGTIEVLAGERQALILTCNVDFGSSGAPVFSFRDGVAKVVSVISAKAEVDGRKVAIAVPLAEPLPALRAALEDSKVGSAGGVKAVSVLSGGNGSGAKFVKP